MTAVTIRYIDDLLQQKKNELQTECEKLQDDKAEISKYMSQSFIVDPIDPHTRLSRLNEVQEKINNTLQKLDECVLAYEDFKRHQWQ